MRIGTWNLEGKWTLDHGAVLEELSCDVWLLTEVPPEAYLAGHRTHLSSAWMGPGKRWAGIMSHLQIEPVLDPHPASVAGVVGGVLFCASVLPWPGSGGGPPWEGEGHGARMTAAVNCLSGALVGDVVWGGDWNMPLAGSLAGGFSRGGRKAVHEAMGDLGLRAATDDLPSRAPGLHTIDHIAVPESWSVTDARHVPISARLSDHDVYWVEAEPTVEAGS